MSASAATLLFVCTGNYYRSRFAEHLFNALAAQAGLPWRAESRGLAIEFGAHNVGPMSDRGNRPASGPWFPGRPGSPIPSPGCSRRFPPGGARYRTEGS